MGIAGNRRVRCGKGRGVVAGLGVGVGVARQRYGEDRKSVPPA